GVISGAASAMVVVKLLTSLQADTMWIQTATTVAFTGVVSALTVGGKAVGKSFAIHYANEIILFVGKVFFFLEHRLGIRLFAGKKNKKNNGKRGKSRAAG